MKIYILFPVLVCLFSFVEHKYLEVYYNEYGSRIEFKDGKFYYIESHSHSSVWYNDTLLVCDVKQIDDQFVELNSTPPNVVVEKELEVAQKFDPIVKDSIKVVFSIPYYNSDLNITVFTNTLKAIDFDYSEYARVLMLPGDVEMMAFSISPKEHMVSHSVDGRYYGVLYYSSAEYAIEEKTNYVKISIPAMDDSFFERYYVKGEYARVVNDTVFWKGDVFVKRK